MNKDKVIAARQKLGLFQREMAERLGVTERTIMRWERAGCSKSRALAIENLMREADHEAR